MADSKPLPAILIHQTDVDSLIESVARSVVDQIAPLLKHSNGPFLANRDDMAKRLDVSTGKLDDLVREGVIPSVTIGTRRLFEPQAVIQALSIHTEERASN